MNKVIMDILSKVLGYGGTWLAAQGYLSSSDAATFVGGATAVLGVVIGVALNYLTRKKAADAHAIATDTAIATGTGSALK